MPTLTIRQQQEFDATVSIDQAGDYPVTVSDPFSPEEEKRLEWYFEEHLRFPFTDDKKAEAAAASVTQYGERLFEQLFADRNAFSEYKEAIRSGLDTLTIEIIGKPDFHQLHWEALKDPDLPDPFAIHANIVRRRPTPQTLRAALTPSPTINVLVVTARPSGSADVGYRTISRPLIETLRQTQLRVNIDLLRPGSYQALVRQLEAKPVGYYHVIHFDVHGALLDFGQLERAILLDRIFFRTRYGREAFKHYDGTRGYLALEGETEGQADFVEAGELAKLLITRQTPMVILNACQSGKQVGASETSLGARLMEAGVQTVLAMSYSVTVSAAKQLMGVLYRQLFDSQPLAVSIRRARAELHRQKERRGYYSQRVALEDWLLPVVYSVGESHNRSLRVSEDTQAVKAWWQRKAEIDAYRQSRRQPTYGFWGRDIDILTIERRLLAGDFVESNTGGSQQSNILLIQGMGGAGKSTLIHHLADWWRTTHLVERVFYFGYDERAWTLQQILHELARQLLDPNTLSNLFLPADLAIQQSMIVQQLASQRHLLLLDNLESITGSPLAIPNALSAEEQKKLADFVAALWGGRTLLLLGSRAPESWLLQRLGNPLYELGGLDPEAASALSDAILQRTLSNERAEQQRKDPNLIRLLRLLAGYPLALEVVLPNLAQQSVAEVLQALEAGDIGLDREEPHPSPSRFGEGTETGTTTSPALSTNPNTSRDSSLPNQGRARVGSFALDKTQSILRCIDYSHSNLDPEAQQLLLALAPFSGVINPEWLSQYIEQLRQQPALAHLPWQRLPAVVEQAKGWGLLAAHPQAPSLLQPQPILPWFLRNRLLSSVEIQVAIETAFRQYYNSIATALTLMMESLEPQQKQIGFELTQMEYENLSSALRLTLNVREQFASCYVALDLLLQQTRSHRRGIELGEMVLTYLDGYPTEQRLGILSRDFLRVMSGIAWRQLDLRESQSAESMYQRCLAWLDQLRDISAQELAGWEGTINHQLGVVAQEQRQWQKAEEYYKKALDTSGYLSQASTYQGLGMVAKEQRKWQEAEAHYKHAMQIYVDINDRYSQSSVYHQLGVVSQEQREWQQAETHYKKALQISIEFDDLRQQSYLYYGLGILLQHQRKWQQAEAHYKEALEIQIDLDDQYPQAQVYHQLGRVAQEQRDWQQAEAYYKKALQIKVDFNDRYEQATIYHQLGVVAQEQQQWQQAHKFYNEALQIKADHNDRYSQGATYHQLGWIAQEQRQWQQAEAYYREALQIFVDYNERYEQAGTYHNLGVVAQMQRQWQQAEDHYKKALQIKIDYNDRYSQGSTYHQLGMIAQVQKQWQQAEEYYKDALQVFIDYSDHYSQASSSHGLGRIAEEKRQWLQAEKYYLFGLQTFLNYQDQHNLGIVLRSLARLWQASGAGSLPAAVAGVLGLSVAEVEELLRQATAG